MPSALAVPRRGGTPRGPERWQRSHPQLLLGQVAAIVDAAVHGHEALEGRSVPDVGVV